MGADPESLLDMWELSHFRWWEQNTPLPQNVRRCGFFYCPAIGVRCNPTLLSQTTTSPRSHFHTHGGHSVPNSRPTLRQNASKLTGSPTRDGPGAGKMPQVCVQQHQCCAVNLLFRSAFPGGMNAVQACVQVRVTDKLSRWMTSPNGTCPSAAAI